MQGRHFDGTLQPNSVSWNVIIRPHVLAGMGDMAVQMFLRMVRGGVEPLVYTVSHALLSYRDNRALE
jgi:pentatricopeptide repeat protein